MKKTYIYNGKEIVASSKKEAIQVIASKSLNLKDLEKSLDYEYDIEDDYSIKEIAKINKFLDSKEGKELVSSVKKEYAAYKKATKKLFDEIKKAEKPVSSKIEELKKTLHELLKDSKDSYLRQDIPSLFKKVATKVGIKDFKIEHVDYNEEDEHVYEYYEIDFKSKRGKKVHIEFEFDEGYYDVHNYVRIKNPDVRINEITYDSSKVSKREYVDEFRKSTINEQGITFEYLYNDLKWD